MHRQTTRYPVNILPNSTFKIISCNISSHYLIRYTLTNVVEDLIDDLGMVRLEHICSPKEHAQDLSTSLLGKFEISHSKIALTESGKEKYSFYCAPNTTVAIPVFNEDFLIDESRHYWVLYIADINNLKVEYAKDSKNLSAECRVCHTPMKWNFWHFSVRWFLIETNCWWHELPDSDKKKDWAKKRLAHEARSLIRMHAKVLEPEYKELPGICYRQ